MATADTEPCDIPQVQGVPKDDGPPLSLSPPNLTEMGGSISPPNSTEIGSPNSNFGSRRSRQQSLDYTLAERDALSQVAMDAEMKLTAKRAARAEARDIRLREIEKLQKESEEQDDSDLTETEKRAPERWEIVRDRLDEIRQMKDEEEQEEEEPERWEIVRDKLEQIKQLRDQEEKLLRQTTTTSTISSRRSSSGSLTGQDGVPPSEMEEKYKKAMMTNAQLDNEKSALIYEVDALKDMLEDQDEQMMEYQREAKEKHRDLQAKKRENANLQNEIEHLRHLVMQRDELIKEHGLLVIANGEESDGVDQTEEKKNSSQLGTIVVIPPEAAQLFEFSGDGPLDVRLKRLVEERKELLEQVRKLKIELDEEKERVLAAERRRDSPPSPSMNGPDSDEIDQHRETARQAKEYKHKLQTTEQKVSTLETTVNRLESQVKRYKTAAETSEASEEELKAEKRKTTRELRTLRDRVEELETENNSLKKRIDKFRKREIH